MNSTLQVNDNIIGKIISNISVKGILHNNNVLKGTIITNDTLKGKLKVNNVPYYATSNEYGSTVYIG